MAWSIFKMTGSFSEDLATLSVIAALLMLMNSNSGRRVTSSLLWFSLGIRSGLLESALGPANSFPRTWTNFRS